MVLELHNLVTNNKKNVDKKYLEKFFYDNRDKPGLFLVKKERSVCLQSSHFFVGNPISKNFEKAFCLVLFSLEGKYFRAMILLNSFW